MMIELKVPSVGESITEVEIGSWLKNEGTTFAKDEPVAVIETEKATVELPAPESGTLVKILKQQGETAKVGETIAHMEVGKTEPTAATNPAPPQTTEKSPSAPARATPLAKRVLAEHDLRVDEVPASGPGGRVSKADVLQHVEQLQKEKTSAPATSATNAVSPSPAPVAKSGPPAREEQVVRMTLLRRTIAKRLVEAQHTAALLTTFNEVDMSAILAFRQQYQEAFQKEYGIKLGFMSFFVKAVIDGLKQFPLLNAEIRDTDIVYHNYHDIGLAVSTDRGLVVPVLPDADRLSFAEIEQAIADFARVPAKANSSPTNCRRHVHHHQRRRLRFAALHTARQPATKRNSWNAHHSGAPRRDGRRGGYPPDDVCRADLRSPHRGRQGSGEISPPGQGCRRKSSPNVLGDLTALSKSNNHLGSLKAF